MLSQLVYVSTRQPNCTEEEVQKILTACKKNNAALDITGVLLYSKTQFVQYLEGEYKAIISLYDVIKKDDRHKNAVLISSSQIQERQFPSWQMGAKKVDTNSIELSSELKPEEKEVFDAILAGNETDSNKALQVMKKLFK